MKQHLPPGLRRRTSKSGVSYYYLKLSDQQREIALGPDRRDALKQWQQYCLARFVQDRPGDDLVRLIDCFIGCEIPVREPNAQAALLRQADSLREYFFNLGNPRPGDLVPDTEAYLTYQGSARARRAGAEIYLFIHIWSWSQRVGLLSTETPCPWRSDAVAAARRHEISSELGAAIGVLLNMVPSEASLGTEAVRDRRSLKSLQQQIAAQLARDARPDLARYLRSLDGAALESVLGNHDVLSTGSEPGFFLLGTRRRDRLQELQRKANAATSQGHDEDGALHHGSRNVDRPR